MGLKYLETKWGSEKFAHAKEIAATIVRSLEQTHAYSNLSGAKKKEIAILQVQEWAKAAKIDIAEGSDGATMIAAAVRDARFDSPDEKAIRNILKEVRKQ